MKKLPIAEIEIRNRYRKDMGDLNELADSLEEIGIIQPVVVTKKNVLIDGERRIRAAKSIGWTEIEVRAVDLANPLKGERDANLSKPFTVSEKVAIAQAIEEEEAEKAAKRKAATQSKQGEKVGAAQGEENFSSPKNTGEKGKAKDKAAEAVGMSAPTLAKAQAVVEAAKADPANADLVEEMNETGKVSAAHRKLEERKGGKAETNGKHEGKAEPKAPETDTNGDEIPERVQEAFITAKSIAAICKDIDAILARAEEASKSFGGRLIRIDSVRQQLKDAKGNLWANRATHVCPYCKAVEQAPCDVCKCEGWTAKHVWMQAPGNSKKAVRA